MKHPEMDASAIRAVSSAALAHVGDAVYELKVRTRLCADGRLTAKNLHKATIARVCAGAQAKAARAIEPCLTQAEHEVYQRGRNVELRHIPAASTPGEYAMATALEALMGWLYLSGNEDRIDELFELCWKEIN